MQHTIYCIVKAPTLLSDTVICKLWFNIKLDGTNKYIRIPIYVKLYIAIIMTRMMVVVYGLIIIIIIIYEPGIVATLAIRHVRQKKYQLIKVKIKLISYQYIK